MIRAEANCGFCEIHNSIALGSESVKRLRIFLSFFKHYVMDVKSILKSKKFWTMVAAIVAALAAFFCQSCSYSARVHRDGIHIDTVRVDYIVRSRNTVAP